MEFSGDWMNRVQHFEIPVDDIARAQEFYERVFGWDVRQAAGMDYRTARTGKSDREGVPTEKGVINGAFFRRADGETPMVVIRVDSVDEHLRQIEEAGGEVVVPRTPAGSGFYARFRDTEGNLAGLWETLKKKSP